LTECSRPDEFGEILMTRWDVEYSFGLLSRLCRRKARS
jgi:hypothetical protein